MHPAKMTGRTDPNGEKRKRVEGRKLKTEEWGSEKGKNGKVRSREM